MNSARVEVNRPLILVHHNEAGLSLPGSTGVIAACN